MKFLQAYEKCIRKDYLSYIPFEIKYKKSYFKDSLLRFYRGKQKGEIVLFLKNGILELSSFEFTIFEHSYSPMVITTCLLEGDHPKIIYVNDAFTKMTGYEKKEILGKTPRILQGEKTDKEVLKRLKECLKTEEYFEGKTINYTKDGQEYWVEWNISPVYDENKQLIAFISIQKDISNTQKLFDHIKLFKKAIDQNHDSIALFNTEGEYIHANASYLKRCGYDMSQLAGNTPKILNSGHHSGLFYFKLWQKLSNKESVETLFCNKNAKGEIYYEKQTITPIVKNETIIGFVSIGKNYDKEEKNKQQLNRELYIDALTKLFNRKMFDLKLKEAVERYTVRRENFCMMFLDLDNFKTINDTLGHKEGDKALRLVADFLTQHIRKSDDIFRYGGDEFVVLLYSTEEKNAQKITQKLEELFAGSEIKKRYPIGLSIGTSQYKGENVYDFFKQTDKKMYIKKRENKSGFLLP